MNYFFLSKTALFNGIQEDEIKHLISCLNGRKKTYTKGEVIYRAGDKVHEIGLVLSGSVNIIVNFYWGGSHIFGHVEKGEIFAENYAAIPSKELICDVIASEDTEVMFLDLSKLLSTCQSCCSFHHRLIHNMLRISAPKGLRDRLLSYLSEQVIIHGSTHFTIPFDRQQLADYLGVDRSAMSNELSKMQKDGLISYKKNKFVLNEMN